MRLIFIAFGLAMVAATSFYGWIIMLAAGALGWNIGFLPAAGLGLIVSSLTIKATDK